MSDARLRTLLAKELDGTLSDLERQELERAVLLAPTARRERAAWARVLEALLVDQDAPSLRIDAMASSIVREVRRRPSMVPHALRRMAVAASLMAAGLALFAVTGAGPEPKPNAEVAELTSPVELRLGLEDPGDDDVAPVTIRF